MTKIIVSCLATVLAFSSFGPAFAHDGAPHKCKKGYILTDDHRCVRSGR